MQNKRNTKEQMGWTEPEANVHRQQGDSVPVSGQQTGPSEPMGRRHAPMYRHVQLQ